MADVDKIVINGIYNYFENGKIRESRMIEVKINDIIPFVNIDESTLQFWKEEVKQYGWLYAKETDYFIKGTLLTQNDGIDVIFVRTIKNNGWFSMGWWRGQLDIDGSLTDSICRNF